MLCQNSAFNAVVAGSIVKRTFKLLKL